jgi:hypothetical protein
MDTVKVGQYFELQPATANARAWRSIQWKVAFLLNVDPYFPERIPTGGKLPAANSGWTLAVTPNMLYKTRLYRIASNVNRAESHEK